MEQIEDRCMFCKNEWNLEFMHMNFTKTFMSKTYKQKNEKLLLEREKSLLPETQQRMEEEKRRQEFNRKVTKLNLLINEKRAMIRRIGGGLLSVTDQELRKKWIKDLEELVRKLEDLYRENNVEKKEEEKAAVISRIACSNEDCRGFLNKEEHRLRCGMCNTIHCNKCRVATNDDEHKCNKDTLETIKLLEKDTKPCPKCSVPIFKIEGCDQMWCTKCHTAFSWKKGTIEEGHIHNPHYWKYLQENGRDLDQVRRMNGQRPVGAGQCQDLRDIVIGTRSQHLAHLSQIIHHFQYSADYNNRDNNINNADGNYDLRKSYLNKEIDEKKMVRILHMRHKKKLFVREMTQIARMMIDTSKDILISRINQLGRLNLDIADFEDCYKEINNLAVYTRDQMEQLYKKYKYTFCRGVRYSLTKIIEYTRTKQIKHYYEEQAADEEDDADVPLAQLGNRLRIQ